MNLVGAKSYLLKLSIFELALFVCAFVLWFFLRSETIPFKSCLFIVGTIFTGLGVLFEFGAHNATADDYYRTTWFSTTMSYSESRSRAWQDIAESYFQSSLFLWSGLIAVVISFLLYAF